MPASESGAKKKDGSAKILLIIGGVALLGCCLCTGAGAALPFIFPGLQFWKTTKDASDMVIKDIKEKDGIKEKGGGKTPNVLLEHKDVLVSTDPQDAGQPYKPFEVNFEQGKVYVIEMTSALEGHYLRLYDTKQKRIAEDGQFPQARITFKARESGKHQIRVTVFKGPLPPGGLGFSLTVRER